MGEVRFFNGARIPCCDLFHRKFGCDCGWLLWFGDVFDGAGGQGIEESFAVGFGRDAGVEDDDDSGVMFGADESSETLFEFEDGFGELVVEEGVSAVDSDLFKSPLEQWFIGYGERQLGDHEVREGFAGDVDALPETIGSQQDAV